MTNDTANWAIQMALMPLELVMSLFTPQGGAGGPINGTGGVHATPAQVQAGKAAGTIPKQIGSGRSTSFSALKPPVATPIHTARGPVSIPKTAQQAGPVKAPMVRAPTPPISRRARFK